MSKKTKADNQVLRTKILGSREWRLWHSREHLGAVFRHKETTVKRKGIQTIVEMAPSSAHTQKELFMKRM